MFAGGVWLGRQSSRAGKPATWRPMQVLLWIIIGLWGPGCAFGYCYYIGRASSAQSNWNGRSQCVYELKFKKKWMHLHNTLNKQEGIRRRLFAAWCSPTRLRSFTPSAPAAVCARECVVYFASVYVCICYVFTNNCECTLCQVCAHRVSLALELHHER